MPDLALRRLKIRPAPGEGGTTPVDPGTFAATHTLGVGRLTMGQPIPKGQVPSGSALAFSGLATQCDIKTTWDDGSARFAVLSADVASGADYPLAVGSPATGTFSPTIPTASVTLDVGATAWKPLGSFAVSSGTAVVRLTDDANQFVIAQSVRLDDGTDADPAARVVVVDGAGFSTVGTWTPFGPTGTPRYFRYAAAGNGSTSASWTFSGLPPGTYRASALWVTDPNRATDAPFRLLDGATERAVVRVNQEIAPSGLSVPGTPYTATLPATASSDAWLSGPICREWRHVVAPKTAGNASHPFLRVYFDVRCYAAGGSRVDINVENCLDVAGATAVDYDVTATVAGSSVFARAGFAHYYLARWRKSFLTGMTASAITPDFNPYHDSAAIPRFLAGVPDTDYSTAGPRYEIGDRGANFSEYMGTTGGRPELAYYPEWVARYVAHGGQSQRAYLLANGDLAGSWPVHLREPDGRLVSIDERPAIWLDARGQQSGAGVQAPKGDLSLDALGPLQPELNHVPSLAFVPYLMSGDRYHCEEASFWANWGLLATIPSTASDPMGDGRGGALGYCGTEQVRGRAWTIRNLADAAAYLPDADPVKVIFAAKVANNLDRYDAYAAGHPTPLNTLFEGESGGYAQYSQWQNNYIAWAIRRAMDHGFASTGALVARVVGLQNRLFHEPVDWPADYAGPYYPRIGTVSGGVATFYQTLAEAWHATYVLPGQQATDGAMNLYGNYGVDARVSLYLAAKLGMGGALSTVHELEASIMPDVLSRSGWALDFGSDAP